MSKKKLSRSWVLKSFWIWKVSLLPSLKWQHFSRVGCSSIANSRKCSKLYSICFKSRREVEDAVYFSPPTGNSHENPFNGDFCHRSHPPWCFPSSSKLQVNSQFEVWRRDLLIQQTCKSLLQRWCIDSDLNFQLIRRQFRQSRFGSMEVRKLANYAFASSFKWCWFNKIRALNSQTFGRIQLTLVFSLSNNYINSPLDGRVAYL